jgi:succinate dehydrogenase / fumarate reductase, cytochrome b subunit
VGAFVIFHLLINASILEGPEAYQKYVRQIHSLGSLLLLFEWIFIFIPILFHATVVFVIIAGALPNSNQYRYGSNYRYTLQRATGMIAFVFIMIHVFHMHGWFHADVWLENVVRPLGGAQFRAYSAPSTAGLALQTGTMVTLYLVGTLATVFHLANGIWTMGITWGVWMSPQAQARATAACAVFGLLLAIVGVGALFGMRNVAQGERLEETIEIEDRMYHHMIESGELRPNDKKRALRQSAVHEDVVENGETTP